MKSRRKYKKVHDGKFSNIAAGSYLNNPDITQKYLETTGSAIVSIDEHGIVREYNRAAAEMFGINNHEMAGRPFSEIMTPESGARAMNQLKRIAKAGHSYGGEYRMIRKDKSIIDARISSTALTDDSGHFIGAISFLEDVTERKFIEAALKESEEKYKAIFNATSDAVFVMRPDEKGGSGRFVAVNRAACDQLGYTAEELLNMTPMDIAAPDQQNVREHITDLKQKKQVTFESAHITGSGGRIPVEITLRAFRIGGIFTVMATARDVTQQRKTELQQAEQAKYKELRAQIWKLAADKNMDEGNLIQGLVDKLGPATEAERVVYSQIVGGKVIATHEWKRAGVRMKASGVSAPVEMLERLDIKEQAVVDKDSVIKLVPGKLRPLMRILIKMFVKRFGDNPGLLTVCYVNGKKEGLITCVKQKSTGEIWPAEMKTIISDAAQIISNAIEQRRIGKELKESELKYRTLFDSSIDAVIVHQPLKGRRPGPIIAVNKTAQARFGYNEAEFLKLNLMDINAPEAKQNPVNATKKIFKDGIVRLETIHITKEGKKIPAEVNATLIEMGGRPTVVASSRDISARKQHEEKENRLRMINLARAEIWKIASDPSCTEGQLLRGLLEKVGAAIGAQRVIYGKPDGKHFIIKNEWKTKDAKRSFNGFKFPISMFEKYELDKQEVFTLEQVLEKAPAALRPVLKPILKLIASRYGDRPSLVTPYYIDGTREGVLVCSPSGEKKKWEMEERQLVNEAAQIISRTFSARRAERKIAESEERFKTAFITSPDCININRMSDGLFADINEGFTRVTGYTRGDVKGKTSEDVNVWNDIRDRKKMVEELKKKGFVDNFEAMFKMKNGDLKFGLMSARIINLKGEPHILSITRDMTERIKAEQAIKESEEKYRELFNNANDAIYINEVDEKGRVGGFVDMNDVAYKITGYSRDEFAKMTPRNLVVPEYIGTFPMIGRALSQYGKAKYEQEIYTKKGKRLIVENNSRKFLLKGRAVVLTIMRDITDRKRFEETLKESDEKYRTIISQTGQLVYEYSVASGIMRWGGAVKEITGYSEDEFNREVSRDVWGEMMHPDDRRLTYELLEKAQDACGEFAAEYRFAGKDGSYRYMFDEGTFICGDDGKAVRMLGVMKDITHRKKSEEILKESEEKFRVAFMTSPDAMILSRISDGILLDCNAGFQKITGYSREDAINKTAEAVYLWRNAGDRDAYMKELKSKGTIDNVELDFRRKDGTIISTILSANTVKIQGEPCIIALAKDISERKAAENGLKESEEKFRTLSEQSAMGILIIQGDEVIYHNDAFLRIHGLNENDMTGFKRADLIKMVHPDDSRALSAEMRKYEKGNAELRKYSFRMFTKNSVLKYVELYSNRVVYKGKQSDFMTIIDITEVKSAENALKESEEKFRTMSEQSLLGIAILQDGRFRYYNQAFLRMAGFSAEEINAMSETEYAKYIHPEDAGILAHRSVEDGQIGRSNSYQFRIIGKSGKTTWLDVYSRNIIYEGSQANFITQADITGLKDTEEKLKKTILELERSNSELERFAYVASHDLQEPLRMISSYVQLLERRYKDKLGGDADEFIGYAVDGAARMQKLIKDLLTYSRLGTREKQFAVIDTNATLSLVKENLAGMIAGKACEIRSGKLPEITADESQIIQLFQNLISNSLKFSRKDEKCVIEVYAEKKGKEWQFCFRDNGIGIDPKYHDKIFVIFQRLHSTAEYSGTGIGLAICKRIVEDHGGRIWVESEENKGAAFYFTIPERKV